MNMIDQGATQWHKSSFSHQDGQCVEQGVYLTGEVAVRDTKAKGAGPVLAFDAQSWNSFVEVISQGK